MRYELQLGATSCRVFVVKRFDIQPPQRPLDPVEHTRVLRGDEANRAGIRRRLKHRLELGHVFARAARMARCDRLGGGS